MAPSFFMCLESGGFVESSAEMVCFQETQHSLSAKGVLSSSTLASFSSRIMMIGI